MCLKHRDSEFISIAAPLSQDLKDQLLSKKSRALIAFCRGSPTFTLDTADLSGQTFEKGNEERPWQILPRDTGSFGQGACGSNRSPNQPVPVPSALQSNAVLGFIHLDGPVTKLIPVGDSNTISYFVVVVVIGAYYRSHRVIAGHGSYNNLVADSSVPDSSIRLK